MRIGDALKLGALSLLYGVATVLACVFESAPARRAWQAVLLPAAGFAVLLLVVVQIPCEHASIPHHRDQRDYQEHLHYQVRLALDARMQAPSGTLLSGGAGGLLLEHERIRLDLFPAGTTLR
jgi:hypothetical protein